MLANELSAAAARNMPARVKLLVEHDTDLDTPSDRDGRSPYQAALLAGNREIAEYLLRHGAKPTELDVTDSFAAACVAGARREALALLAQDRTLIEKLGAQKCVELVHT